jgi:hypothetical protein
VGPCLLGIEEIQDREELLNLHLKIISFDSYEVLKLESIINGADG